MRAIHPPDEIDAADLYDDVVQRRRSPAKEDLLAARTGVCACYDHYHAALSGNDVSKFTSQQCSPASAEDLRANYRRMREIRHAAIENLQLRNPYSRCLFCSAATASQLDHFLPKTRFAEFAILPRNLIPCCTECNREKGSEITEGGEQTFLHPYLDVLPEEQFLFANLHGSGDALAASFRIESDEFEDPDLASLVERHFRALSLPARYAEEAAMEISERRASVQAIIESGGGVAKVAEYFGREAASVAEGALGVNSWKSALLRALSENPDVWE